VTFGVWNCVLGRVGKRWDWSEPDSGMLRWSRLTLMRE
jgi:hypothetical protein